MTEPTPLQPSPKGRVIVTNLPQYAAFFPENGTFKISNLDQQEVIALAKASDFLAFATDDVGLKLLDEILGKQFPLVEGRPPYISADVKLLVCEANLLPPKTKLFVPNAQPEIQVSFHLFEKVDAK